MLTVEFSAHPSGAHTRSIFETAPVTTVLSPDVPDVPGVGDEIPFYKKGWFWGIVGVAGVAGLVFALTR